ncbi:unnamed protein product [Urochloa decumbens]|uniref:PGG domain-containing protein n=1 Tax=Urochloa decumbens TaxID=240449 RepID=A0ABC8WE34_9POAL
MDEVLLQAAVAGDSATMKNIASQDPGALFAITPDGNTCLHISSVHGHEEFCKDVVAQNPYLLAAVNPGGETPLLSAVTSGRASLASALLRWCCDLQLSAVIVKEDNDGCNALHHAIRSGHTDLALELIAAEPSLSQSVNKYSESPMFIAALRDFADVFERLLEIPESADVGIFGNNALHAAVRNGNADFTEKIMMRRPHLARETAKDGSTPMQLAVLWGKTDVLRVMLQHDRSLGYVVTTPRDSPMLLYAAHRGHVGVARELLSFCPDSPYRDITGWTCLHMAVDSNHPEFVEFILETPQLRRLVNMRDKNGKTALHYAVGTCRPRIVAALLLHQDTDFTIMDSGGWPVILQLLNNSNEPPKTLNWNEVFMLLLKADRTAAASPYVHELAKKSLTNESRKDVRSLTQTYTSNTSLVAILIATITFAAAFTLPGGYSSDAGSQGLPIMSKKFAFQAFLVFDTLAMCSSLAVAFICIVLRWEDYEFLLYYRSFILRSSCGLRTWQPLRHLQLVYTQSWHLIYYGWQLEFALWQFYCLFLLRYSVNGLS